MANVSDKDIENDVANVMRIHAEIERQAGWASVSLRNTDTLLVAATIWRGQIDIAVKEKE